MEFTVKQIAALLNGDVEGNDTALVARFAKIEEGRPGDISFLANPKYETHIYDTHATAVIVNRTFQPQKPFATSLIRVDDAYLGFAQLLEEYRRLTNAGRIGAEEPVFMGEGSQIGENSYRGAFSYIGRNCRIGSHVKLYPQTYIGDNVQIGDYTVLLPGARLHDNTVVGRYCVIKSNAVIGGEGFGFAPQADGTYRPIPQLGNVVIEDHVSIGAGTTIDCATMGSTIIRTGAKLDNLIQIGHNVEIGSHTVIAAQTGVSGSTRIGDHCVIGGQVGFAGHLSIAGGTKVGAQSGVGKNVVKEGTSLNSSPAFDLKESMRSLALFRKLPDLERRLSELEKKQ